MEVCKVCDKECRSAPISLTRSEENVDFLGYSFGRCYSPKTGRTEGAGLSTGSRRFQCLCLPSHSLVLAKNFRRLLSHGTRTKANLPPRSMPQTCLKPRKSNVSGFSPVFARSARTKRPKRYRLAKSPYATLCTGGSDGFVVSTAAPIASTGWSDPAPGRAFHPAVDQRFSRRTAMTCLHQLM